MENTIENRNSIRVVLYLRLSDEDRNKLTKEQKSESIKNQESMLRDYATEQHWEIISIYDDEDWSGADVTRPNFNKMIVECQNGSVDIVLVKSQARFARDLEIVEKYVYNKFIEWNVRFVTLMEKIDNTRRETRKTSQIIGLTDQWYLEDTSHNIRETFRTKRKKGEFTGAFTVYGYKKDPENKNHLIPDSTVSNNVIRIFEEYNRGYGMDKIATGLDRDNILSPLEYKHMIGCKLKLPVIRDYMDYKNINKSGTFVVRIQYKNEERKILKQLTTVEVFTDDVCFCNKVDITLVKVKNDNIKLYYSTKSLDELNMKVKNKTLLYDNHINFNSGDWNPICINQMLPKGITCIATKIEELENLNEIYYEYEVTLRENRNHVSYYYKVFPNSNNDDTNLEYKIQIRNKHKWNSSTIRKILNDETYIGNLVQFKTTTVSYKNHKIIYNEKEKQIRVENTHRPIVDKDLWYSVQEKLKRTKKCCKNGKTHILANKVFCENCHRTFYKCGKGYLCCRDRNTKWSNCDNIKFVRQSVLEELIKGRINYLLKRFYNEEQLKINDSLVNKNLFREKISNFIDEKEAITKELKTKNFYFQGLYEDRRRGFVDDREYLLLRSKYKEECQRLEDRVKDIERSLSAIEQKQDLLRNNRNLFSKYKQIDQLNIEIVNDFISQIIIGKYDEITKSRKVHIIWNFNN